MLKEFESPAVRQSGKMDALARQAVFGTEDEKAQARWLIWEIGQRASVRPASIHELYMARGRGDVPAFTTPAMNVRILSYDSGRAIFRAAKRLDVGAIICEIARSEIAYTDQRPAEYVAVMTAAALREGFTGPLFIQGDHVQVNAKKYAADPEAELKALRALIEEELHAGFYNVDIDTSTLVDLSKPNLDEQQRTNYERAAELTKFIRDREPDDVTVSVGAKIGEVGGKNSDVHELKAFMDGYNRTLQKLGTSAGISKISGLHGDLRNTGRGPQLLQRPVVAVHERLQLVHVAVLAADFADLRTDGHGDVVRLAVPDELRELGGALVVRPLLLVEIGLGEIDERGRIDVDVVEAGVQLFLDQCAQRLELGRGIGRVLLGVDLDVVALDEQRPCESLAQRRGRHHRDVLGGPLVGVGDLAPGDLADDRSGVESLRRPEDRAPGVVGENPDVHRGRGERRHVTPAPRHVQLVNRGGPDAGALPDLPDQPARLGLLVFVPEHGLTHQLVHPGALPDDGIVEFLEHASPPGGI